MVYLSFSQNTGSWEDTCDCKTAKWLEWVENTSISMSAPDSIVSYISHWVHGLILGWHCTGGIQFSKNRHSLLIEIARLWLLSSKREKLLSTVGQMIHAQELPINCKVVSVWVESKYLGCSCLQSGEINRTLASCFSQNLCKAVKL